MKSIMFKTKIFHEGKMYLLVSDVTKMMEISEKAFCKKYSDKIVEIPGCRKCIAETDFNLLISSIAGFKQHFSKSAKWNLAFSFP